MRLDAPYILVIDDDDSIRELLRLLLEQHGYRALLAPDGEVGLALAETHHPDVILLDVAMPRRDGMDVYLDLRHNPRISDIPVLVLSASLTERDIQTWRGLTNVVDAIMKPFDVYELLDRLDQICNRGAAQAGA